MEISVNEAQKRIGELFPFEWEGELDSIEFKDSTIRFTDKACISGSFTFDGKAFTVSGRLTASYPTNCGRCGKELVERMDVEFSELFKREGTIAEDEECYPYSGDRLDLSAAINDCILLNLPLVNLCNKKCKGLCPICGTDLNISTCNCSPVDRSNPFAVLLQHEERQ